MTWSTADMPDQTGRVAVVTGANGGLGLASATALAGRGAHVVMAARNQEKARAARDEILAAHPRASLEIVELDLGSLASVERAATEIAAAHDRIDILIGEDLGHRHTQAHDLALALPGVIQVAQR